MRKGLIYKIKNKYSKDSSTENLIKNYFVEIFSWSVFPKELLNIIIKLINDYKINYIIDPCCGNAFHTFLFDVFSKFITFSIDIQNEENSWKPIVEKDGCKFLDELNHIANTNGVLILSWINGEELANELLNRYNGIMVLSIGNYDKNSTYYKNLNSKFNCSVKYNLLMPWNLNEEIEIYIRV